MRLAVTRWVAPFLFIGCTSAPGARGVAGGESEGQGDASVADSLAIVDARPPNSGDQGGPDPTRAPDGHDAAPSRPRLIVLTRTEGYRHDSIPAAADAIRVLGEAMGLEVVVPSDETPVSVTSLDYAAAVVLLSTTGDFLESTEQTAVAEFVAAGGGLIGIHAAADAEYDWPGYPVVLGAWFAGHPAVQEATVHVTAPEHPAVSGLPGTFTRTDEWYNFRPATNAACPGPACDPFHAEGVTVLLTVDEASYEGGAMGERHPIAWAHTPSAGRVFYTAMGHATESYTDPTFLEHLRLGLRWAARRDEALGGF